MKYIDIYNDEYVPNDVKTLFGTFNEFGNFKIEYDNAGYYKIVNKTSDSKKYYGEVDEFKLYNDIIKYGGKIYKIVKNNLLTLKLKIDRINPPLIGIHMISSNLPDDVYNKLNVICLNFVNDYNIPINNFHPILEAVSKFNLQISTLDIANEILFIYMIHVLNINKSLGFNKFHNLYTSINLSKECTDQDVSELIMNFIDNAYRLLNELGKYNLKLLYVDGKYIPIRYVTNLFTLAHEVLIANIASNSFYEYNDETHTYTLFSRCTRCLKNIYYEVEKPILDLNRAKTRKRYCNDCKMEIKRMNDRKYEHSIRVIYDYLKSNISNISDSMLKKEIENLEPKDKVKKSYLKELELKLNKNLSHKNDRV